MSNRGENNKERDEKTIREGTLIRQGEMMAKRGGKPSVDDITSLLTTFVAGALFFFGTLLLYTIYKSKIFKLDLIGVSIIPIAFGIVLFFLALSLIEKKGR